MNLTFQILDGGQTFLVPVSGMEGSIGADSACTIRLTEPGVEPVHARFQPLPDGSLRLVDEGLGSPVKVNGEEVMQWRLQVGDRVEIGTAVLVVGQRIERQATAADVVRESTPSRVAPRSATRSAAPRARPVASRSAGGRPVTRRTGDPAKRSVPWIPIGVAVAAALIALLVTTDSGPGQPQNFPLFTQDMAQGNHERAAERLADWRRSWAEGQPERVAFLNSAAREVEVLRTHAERFRRSVLEDPSLGLSGHRERLELAMEGRDRSDPEVIAARAVMSELGDLLDQARQARRAELASAAGDRSGSPTEDGLPSGENGGGVADAEGRSSDDPGRRDPESAVGAGASGSGSSGLGDARSDIERDVARRVLQLVATGDFVQAESVLVQAIDSLPGDQVGGLTKRLDELRLETRRRADAMAERLIAVADRGDIAEIQATDSTLGSELSRFPPSGRTTALATALERFSRAREVGRSLASDRSPESVARSGSRLLQRGAFVEAEELHRRFAESVAQSQPEVAAQHEAYADEARTMTRLYETAQSRHPAVLEGDPGSIFDVPAADWEALLEGHNADAPLLMAAAALAYQDGSPAAGDALFRVAERRAGVTDAVLSASIARARGESATAGGYEFRDGRYLSAREIRLQERIAKLERDLDTLLRAKPERWDQRLEELVGDDDDAVDVLVAGLRRAAESLASRLEADRFREVVNDLEVQRREVDVARASALDLIYDTVLYFHPYKPPAVSGERYAEYRQVQDQIDERTAEVRSLVERYSHEHKIPAKLLDNVARIRWVTETLASLNEFVPGLADRIAWVRRLPTDEPLSLRTLALDDDELALRSRAAEVRAYNEEVAALLTSSENELLRRTNDYRELMGREPVVCDLRLMEAARGHALEMADLGYFSHYSPTEGRRTPNDRMRLAGYHEGASENLAQHPTAESSIEGWRNSSGHHRNMLQASLTEIGVAQAGRMWVQVFGRGVELEPVPRPGRRR